MFTCHMFKIKLIEYVNTVYHLGQSSMGLQQHHHQQPDLDMDSVKLVYVVR